MSTASKFLSPTGNDANPCTKALPCKTFNRAYRLASPGDVVELAAGTYNNSFRDAANLVVQGERLEQDTTKTSPDDVVFRPASGANVIINGDITSHASHFTVKDIEVQGGVYLGHYDKYGVPDGNFSHDITIENISGRDFLISASNVTIKGGEYGPGSACGGDKPNLPQYGGGNNKIGAQAQAADPANIVIDGVTIHDIMSYSLVNCHTEGLAIFCGTNVTVRNSKFYGNDVYNILVQSNSGCNGVRNVTLENNWFGATTREAGTGSGSAGVDFNVNDTITVRHNSFNSSLLFEFNSSFINTKIIGNIGFSIPSYALSSGNGSMCGAPGVTMQYNLWQNGGTCGSTERSLSGAAFPYVNTANDSSLNYHLLPGSPAKDLVPSAISTLIRDIDGDTRPLGTANDAGADELE